MGFNPDGALNDANNITIAGNYAYITTAQGLVIVNLDDPLNPQLVRRISLKHPTSVAIQFRYAFVVDDEGLKVIDVTMPEQPRLVEGAFVPLAHAHDVYVARTYAYVANGKEGIAIVDVEQPERPRLDQMYNAGGKLNDVHQVKVAMTNASLFAYVADGKNGMRILQLTSPETMPEYAGFSPRPQAGADRDVQDERRSAGNFEGLWIAIARWMRVAIRFQCLGDAARGRLRTTRC